MKYNTRDPVCVYYLLLGQESLGQASGSSRTILVFKVCITFQYVSLRFRRLGISAPPGLHTISAITDFSSVRGKDACHSPLAFFKLWWVMVYNLFSFPQFSSDAINEFSAYSLPHALGQSESNCKTIAVSWEVRLTSLRLKCFYNFIFHRITSILHNRLGSIPQCCTMAIDCNTLSHWGVNTPKEFN